MLPRTGVPSVPADATPGAWLQELGSSSPSSHGRAELVRESSTEALVVLVVHLSWELPREVRRRTHRVLRKAVEVHRRPAGGLYERGVAWAEER